MEGLGKWGGFLEKGKLALETVLFLVYSLLEGDCSSAGLFYHVLKGFYFLL